MNAEKKEIEFPLSGDGMKEWWKTATLAQVERLVKQGAEVNARNEGGFTPLHYAVEFNPNPAVIEALVELGADVHARNEWGQSPLRYAEELDAAPAIIEALMPDALASEAFPVPTCG